jgi:MFS family permease
VLRILLPMSLAVGISFLSIGMLLPVLAVYLQQHYGLSPMVMGWVIAAQFAAALLSRAWAGACADQQGAQYAIVLGMLLAGTAGWIYGLSVAVSALRNVSISLLLIAGLILGCGESFIVTAALGWGWHCWVCNMRAR